ncbi:hypothetical protein GCM10009422_22780 [Brevundimonas kwangchunensis]|uniref:Uncharacterized protein n=1 Tax=Brevundimonas kwangchunensis TaxID=322163 RepID=A0ABP3S4F7_9CAUL
MTHHDPNLDPAPGEIVRETVVTRGPRTETVETVVVRESNTGWWVAGILGGVVLIAVLWILFARGAETPVTDQALLDAQVDAVEAQAAADRAAVAGQVASAQASVDIARADAVRSQAEAARASADARAAEARATEPLIIERQTTSPAPPMPSAEATVRPTAPQN